MTRHEIAILACKILALWMFAQTVFFGFAVLLMIFLPISSVFTDRQFRWSELSQVAVSGIPALGTLATGLLLWLYAPRLATRMVSDVETPVTREDVTQSDLMSIAFAATGVFLLIPVLRDLAGDFIFIAKGSYPFLDYWNNSDWQASFWSSVIGLGFSIWLIFGSRGIARLVRWSRTAGVRHADVE